MWKRYSLDHVYNGGLRHYEGDLWGVTSVLSATRDADAQARIDNWASDKTPEERAAPAQRGTDVHSLMENIILGNPQDIPEEYLGYVQSAQRFLDSIVDVHLVEGTVWSNRGYAGTADLVADIKSPLTGNIERFLVDWKTSTYRKPDKFLKDYFLQAAAYCGAVNQTYDQRINRAKVVVLQPKGTAQVRDISSDEIMCNWRIWLVRLEQYVNMIEAECT